MRERIGAEQLNTPITNQEIDIALENSERTIEELSALPEAWVCFCNEKLLLASESLGFLLRQRVQIYKQGYPSRNNTYLNLIERQIEELKQVYISFYRLAPGLIHQQKDVEPNIYTWLMFQNEFCDDLDNLLSGVRYLDELDTTTATLIVAHSSFSSLDNVLADLIEGNSKSAPLYFECLRLRQTLSVGLIKHWYKTGRINAEQAFPTLALQDVEEGISWLNENAQGDDYLFERLITKGDRSTWFRRYFGTEVQHISSSKTKTFAKLLEIKELMEFDVESPLAHIDFVLSGDCRLVLTVIENLEHLDDHQYELWLEALYVVYGALLPIRPRDLGIEYDRHQALDLLNEWVTKGKHMQNSPSRLGYALNFDTTLTALQDSNISFVFREWLWQQLCIQSRAYVPWNMVMPVHQQDWNFRNFKATPSVSERFNLRSSNAVVGY
ncbi:hypothetical protein FCU94_04805 [Vibrio sp. JPW-9-11-11]|uniref:hypothetical protein n=1 Tax=Vibrio sp. JPW-9-11-11 TaxID=1416532 RepID=UPI0015940C64|nr:hypothetical protein [Vibrio sp. JPW-9-11-11]NVD06229.1 hypothetical protein [Vibrio sp. JPW-9-11-11]